MQNTESTSDSSGNQCTNQCEKSLIKKYCMVGLFGNSLKFIEMLHMVEAACRCEVYGYC